MSVSIVPFTISESIIYTYRPYYIFYIGIMRYIGIFRKYRDKGMGFLNGAVLTGVKPTSLADNNVAAKLIGL